VADGTRGHKDLTKAIGKRWSELTGPRHDLIVDARVSGTTLFDAQSNRSVRIGAVYRAYTISFRPTDTSGPCSYEPDPADAVDACLYWLLYGLQKPHPLEILAAQG